MSLEREQGGQSPPRKRSLAPFVIGIMILAALGCVVLILGKRDEEAAVRHERTGEIKRKVVMPTGVCGDFCQARLQQRRAHHGGDYLSNDDLLTLVQDARQTVVSHLKVKYGDEYFSKMFESSKGKIRLAFVGTGKTSMQRFQRKLQLKILEVQAAIHQDNTQLRSGCDCNGGLEENATTARRLKEKVVMPSIDSFFADFVWATTGHSAAAGHGNLFNESYTAHMAQVAKPVFESIGIMFEGRNYAMGGMRSAPQVALCNEALFGTDASVLSWDFGMTDGRNYDLKALFAQRAGVHRNRPVLVDMNQFGKMWKDRIKELKVVDDKGLTTLHIAETAHDNMVKDIPDMFGLSQEQIDAVPAYVRDMKCNDQFEKGNPTCGANKYNPICAERKHKAGWHPGWRVNAMYGYSIGLFLIESLVEAIQLLGPTGYNPQSKFQQLKAEEDKDYENFFQSAVPPSTKKKFTTELSDDLDSLAFFRNRAMCRTALLPSESRFKGYLEGNATAGAFDPGVPLSRINKEPAEGKLRIAFDEKDRQDWCPVTLKIDHKDHFYANENDGWVSLTFPNEAELKAYGPFDDSRGIVMICFVMCDWGKCPQGDRNIDALNKGDLQITINDAAVTSLTVIEGDCGIAKSDTGWTFPRNDQGQYKVSVKVKETGEHWIGFTRITSIVVV